MTLILHIKLRCFLTVSITYFSAKEQTVVLETGSLIHPQVNGLGGT